MVEITVPERPGDFSSFLSVAFECDDIGAERLNGANRKGALLFSNLLDQSHNLATFRLADHEDISGHTERFELNGNQAATQSERFILTKTKQTLNKSKGITRRNKKI
jgi:hypothetical protein